MLHLSGFGPVCWESSLGTFLVSASLGLNPVSYLCGPLSLPASGFSTYISPISRESSPGLLTQARLAFPYFCYLKQVQTPIPNGHGTYMCPCRYKCNYLGIRRKMVLQTPICHHTPLGMSQVQALPWHAYEDLCTKQTVQGLPLL